MTDEQKRRLIHSFIARLEAFAERGDIPATGFAGRCGTLMRWTHDPGATEEDEECGLRRLGMRLVCRRAVQSLCHGRVSVTCRVHLEDGTQLWVYAHDVDWVGDEPDSPKSAA